jgi:mono/diheme cytochrome c family protein
MSLRFSLRRAVARPSSTLLLSVLPGWAIVLAAVVLLAAAGHAASAAGPDAEAAARGAINYRIYCQNCHGPAAHGDGQIAEILKVRPADLTHLTEADGTFPRQRVADVIDGRREVAGHGRREMPIWGLAFQDRGRDNDQEAEVAARIADLVAYLESIQAPRE